LAWVELEGFRLLSSSIISVIEGVCVFLSGNYRYIKVFKLLVHLGIRAYLAILPRGLFYYNLSLLGRPFYLGAIAFYKVFIEFPFRLSRDFEGG
jgi:hypothetical protein